MRALKGLEDIIDLYLVHPQMGPDGWYFSDAQGGLPEDPLHGFKTLKELYLRADPRYKGRYSVPVLWDKKADVMVNNESGEIIRMFYSEFDHLLPPHLRESNKPDGGLYPPRLRGVIDEINDWVLRDINTGVYRVGFATTQGGYDAGVKALFSALGRLEEQVAASRGPFLLGQHLTEVDVLAYTTLVRFDVAYNPVMLCTVTTIRHGFPRLHTWLRRLYWDAEAVREETRAAFSSTTQPHIVTYTAGYAAARHRAVYNGVGPLIIPAQPDPVMMPMD